MNVYAPTSGNYLFQPSINSAVEHMLALVSFVMFEGTDISMYLIFVSYL